MGRDTHWGREVGRRCFFAVSLLVWAMIGIAIWHFCVLLPDRFAGGIVRAFIAALGGAVVSGYALPSPGIPVDNPP